MSLFPYSPRNRSLLQAIIDSSPCRDGATRHAEQLLEAMKPAPEHEPDDYSVEPQTEIGKDEL